MTGSLPLSRLWLLAAPNTAHTNHLTIYMFYLGVYIACAGNGRISTAMVPLARRSIVFIYFHVILFGRLILV